MSIAGLRRSFIAVSNVMRSGATLRGGELQRALEAFTVEVRTPTARAVVRQAMVRRWPVTIAASALLLVPPIAALTYFYQVRADKVQAEAMIKNRRSVAVVALTSPRGAVMSMAHEGFGIAFAELLSAELAGGEQLRRVPADSVARTQIDLKLTDHGTYSPDELAALRQQLGVDLFVAGTDQADDASRLRIRIDV